MVRLEIRVRNPLWDLPDECDFYLSCDGHAPASQLLRSTNVCSHHAELGPLGELDQVSDLLRECRLFLVLGGVWVGLFVACVGVAEVLLGRHLGGGRVYLSCVYD